MPPPSRDAGSSRTTSSGKRIRKKKPSPVQRARAQEQQYVSQGRAVERAANEQRKARSRPAPKIQPGPFRESERKKVERQKRKPSYREALREARKKGPATRRGTKRPGGDDKSAADRERAVTYVRRQYRREGGLRLKRDERSTVIPEVAKRTSLRKAGEARRAEFGQRVAPALTVLEQTVRPLHGVAAGTRAAIKGKNVPKAVGRGLALKDKSTFSDVLKDVGVPKAVAGPAGLVADIALDPTTYVTGGAAAGAKTAARKAAEKATREAAKAGASKKAADKAGRAAAAKVLKKGVRPGVSVGVGKKARVTVRAPKPAAKAGRKVRESGPYQTLRHVNPNVRPPGVSKDAWERARAATRKERAVASVGERESKDRAVAIARKVKDPKSHDRITDALEARDLSKLSPDERKVAKTLQDDYEKLFREEKSRKLITSRTRELGYAPRRHKSELEPPKRGSKARTTAAHLSSSKQRTEKRARAEFRGTQDDVFVDDVATARYLRGRESAVKQGRAQTFKELQRLGARFKGQAIKEGEALYRFHPRAGVTEVTGDELKKVLGAWAKHQDAKAKAVAGRFQGRKAPSPVPPGLPEGKYIVLNQRLVERTIPKRIDNAAEELGRVWDRQLQGRIKTILTVPNPQYHFTNLYGDLWKAYTGTNAASLARNLGVSAKVMARLAKRRAAAQTLGKQLDPSSKGVKIGGKRVTYDELIEEAELHGAIGQGFLGRDLPEVLEQQGRQALEAQGKGRVAKRFGKAGRKVAGSRVGRRVGHPIDAIRDVSQYREDAVRLATYLSARKKGMTPDQASAHVADTLIDYGDLSAFERSVMRRVFPFYTFTARNVPQQAKALVTRPGKFATAEKVREEAAKATAGLPEDYEGELREFEQRGVPVAIPFKIPGLTGKDPSLLYPKLPLADLNRLGIRGQRDAILAMVSPILKSPVEAGLNYSFFFKEPIDKYGNIEDPYTGKKVRQLKPVPGWFADAAGKVPGLRERLGMRRYTPDRKDPKKTVWGWPAHMDFWAKQTPLSGTALQMGTETRGTRGQTGTQRIVRFGSGLNVTPFESARNKENKLFARREYLNAVAESARRQSVPFRAKTPTGRDTPEYRKVLDEINRIEKQLGIKRGRVSKSLKWSDQGGDIKWSDEQGGVKWSD